MAKGDFEELSDLAEQAFHSYADIIRKKDAEIARLRKDEKEAMEMLQFTGESCLWQAAAHANQENAFLRSLVRQAFEEGRTQFNDADDSWERSDARRELDVAERPDQGRRGPEDRS